MTSVCAQVGGVSKYDRVGAVDRAILAVVNAVLCLDVHVNSLFVFSSGRKGVRMSARADVLVNSWLARSIKAQRFVRFVGVENWVIAVVIDSSIE